MKPDEEQDRTTASTPSWANTNEQLPLNYTAQWIILGIVSEEDIRRDYLKSIASDDPHPEHYRWRAFDRFFESHRHPQHLSASLAHQLYALGSTDAHPAMGGAMMAAIVRHPDCPDDLLQSALTSAYKHLKRIAAQRLNTGKENA